MPEFKPWRGIPLTPPTQHAVFVPHGWTLGPMPHLGPLAMVMSTREDNGEHVTSFIAASLLFPLITADEDGEDHLDVSAVPQDQFCEAVAQGWPDEWPQGGAAWALANGMAGALMAGIPWETVKARAEHVTRRSSALLN